MAIITDQATFDKLYFAAQPPELRHQIDANTALALATKGFKVDVPIMVWGWSPYLVMHLRQSFGFTWTPAALGAPITIAPGLSAPGTVPYDPLHAPAGSIKVSLDSVDYPPFDAPLTPSPAHTGSPVGPWSGFGAIYDVIQPLASDGAKTAAGDDPRGIFTFHSTATPFGHSVYYTKD